MTVIGPDAANIFNTFSLTEAEIKYLSVIKTKSDDYYAPKTNITYERYLFNKITQAEGQPFNNFLTLVINQGKKCDDMVHEKFLDEEDLTFDKTVKICRASEITKLQVSVMRGDTLHSVHAMHTIHKKMLYESQETEFKMRSKCPKCSYNHTQTTCPAVRKECKKRGEVGHFAKVCRSKQVLNINSGKQGRTPEPSSLETFFVWSIDSHQKELDWIEKLTLPNKIYQVSLRPSGTLRLKQPVDKEITKLLKNATGIIILVNVNSAILLLRYF
ncbi:hypothetical protein PR048_001123 [Dryococelus australis]|uniref:Uncharacterized protein n=1 Tax=Dryococelus australis TaxID=614101 RepID=A0ABQ9IGH3_9NEOP|nr:hypothetical protein PR048_001123 [Dryococelus australis]